MLLECADVSGIPLLALDFGYFGIWKLSSRENLGLMLVRAGRLLTQLNIGHVSSHELGGVACRQLCPTPRIRMTHLNSSQSWGPELNTTYCDPHYKDS